jgi:hypothetical protein
MYTKTLLCLANSRKPPNGRCVAGREISGASFGDWVRPVSARPTEEVSEEERRYEDGRDPEVLHVLDVPLAQPVPRHHQVENHQIDDGYYWGYERSATWPEVLRAVEQPATLWVNGYSTYNGHNDRVPDSIAFAQKSSLVLVRPEQLAICVVTEGATFGNPRRRVRARFQLNGVSYNFVVTDPVIERQYLRLPGDRDDERRGWFAVRKPDRSPQRWVLLQTGGIRHHARPRDITVAACIPS